ncbi:MAG: hypothetical protein KJ686_04990 [Actinobacteria bacterium]|nr:hypothetical protein [Actinomycetota bacterium]
MPEIESPFPYSMRIEEGGCSIKNLPTTPNKSITVLLVVFLLAAFVITLTGCKADKPGLGDKDSSKTEPAAEKEDREDLERARAEAKARLDQAKAAISDLQAMGIDTSDLNEYINTAQFMYVYAETPEEYMGITDSAAYWATVVINCCHEKKEAYLAALAEEEEDIEEYYEVENVEEGPVDPRPDDDDLVDDAITVYFYGYATEEQVHSVAARHGCYISCIMRCTVPDEYEGDWITGVCIPEQMDPDEAVEVFSGEPLVREAHRMGRPSLD